MRVNDSGPSPPVTQKNETVSSRPQPTPAPKPRNEVKDNYTPVSAQKPVELSPKQEAQARKVDPGVVDALKQFGGRNVDVAKLLKDGKLQPALQKALNSEGDSITLKLGASGSITTQVAVNVGGGASGEAVITKTKDGYELKLTHEAKVTAGLEVAQGTEGNIEGGVGISPKFNFKTLAEAEKGLVIASLMTAQTASGGAGWLANNAGDLTAKAVATGADVMGDVAKHIPFVGDKLARKAEQVEQGARTVDSVLGPDALKFMQDHMSGVSVKGSAAAELANSLGILSVQLGNFGTERSVKNKREWSLEIEFGPPATASLDSSVQVEIKGNAGVGVGVAAEGTATVKLRDRFELSGSLSPLDVLQGKAKPVGARQTEATASIELDAKGKLAYGMGVSVDSGAGVKTTFTLDGKDLGKALTAEAMVGLGTGDPRKLLGNLADVPVKMEAELYGTSGANLQVGVSYFGTGGKLEGEARWNDVLLKRERTATGRQLLNETLGLTRDVLRLATAQSEPFKAGPHQAVVG